MSEHVTGYAERVEGWWVVHLHDVGRTQGRSVAEAQRMAVGLVAVERHVPESEVTVDIDFRPPAELADEVQDAREATARAARAQTEAAEASRRVVARLLDAGLSRADVARVLGVGAQRVSQLAPRRER